MFVHNKNVLSPVLGAGKSKTKVRADSVSGKILLSAKMAPSSMSSQKKEQKGSVNLLL